MRKILLLTLLLTFLGGSGAVMAQTSGGPDLFGYQWENSNSPTGPAFNWVDTTGRNFTRVMGLTDDNSVGPVSIGFDFRFYWTDLNEIKVGSNGWLGFNNTGNIAACFPTIPTAGGAGDHFLAPFMSDLNFNSSYPAFPNVGELWWWTNNTDSVVFSWYNVPWWKDDAGGTNPPDWGGSNTFQVILSAVDSSITYQYLDVDQANFIPSGFCATDLEIGIENITGNIGIATYTGTTLPDDSLAVKYSYPGTVTFQVPDATPAWNANSDNAGQFYLAGSNVDMLTNIENVGNADIASTINISGSLTAIDLTTVIWSDNSSLPSLTAGTNQTVTFPTQATMNPAGQYYYDVDITNGNDINPSNNNNRVEVSVIEPVAGVYGLTYSTLNPPDGALAWGPNSGDYGGGIFIDPPVTPAQINSVECFILGDGDPLTPMTSGFKVQVFEPDVAGNPVVLLAADSVNAGGVIENDWNTITFSNPPTITTGGFYVSWIQGGDSIGLGTEAFGPISRRTFEILNGQWATYRESSVEDFLIKVNVDAAVAVDPSEMPAISQLTLYPNPGNELVTIGYTTAERGDVQIAITDMMGRVVYQNVHSNINAGTYRFAYNSRKLEAGVYFVTLNAGNEQLTQKMVINH